MIALTVVIDLNPNLFKIGPFLITWHGVFAVLGILAFPFVAVALGSQREAEEARVRRAIRRALKDEDEPSGDRPR